MNRIATVALAAGLAAAATTTLSAPAAVAANAKPSVGFMIITGEPTPGACDFGWTWAASGNDMVDHWVVLEGSAKSFTTASVRYSADQGPSESIHDVHLLAGEKSYVKVTGVFTDGSQVTGTSSYSCRK